MKKNYNTFTDKLQFYKILLIKIFYMILFALKRTCTAVCLTRKYLALVIFSVVLSDNFFHIRLKHLVHIHCSVGALSSKRVSNTLAQYATPHTYMNK